MGRAAAVRANTKGKTDALKAKTRTLFGKKIIMAVKAGGPDQVNNKALADVIRQAKASNVPADNITRAIKRASEVNTADFAESTFEAYGFGGASLVINVLSDNSNRASADVKNAIRKKGGKVAESGSVLFMYDRKGKVEVNDIVNEEELLDAAIEAGVDDMEFIEKSGEGPTIIYTDPKETNMMVEAVKSLGHKEIKSELVFMTKAPVEVTEEEFEKNMLLIDDLEEIEDVDSVDHNMSN